MAVQVAFTGLKKASDVAGLVSPSNLAQAYVAKRDGEDLRTTLHRSRQNVDASYQRVRGMLTTRISAARADRNEAYNL
jgi:predicted ATPase